jgi:quercetin dioxygenase-like cupin family protein
VRPGDVLENRVTGHRYEVVHCAADTSGALLEMVTTFPPGVPEPPDHFHSGQVERFEVLDGRLELRVAGARRQLCAGDTVIVPAGTRHAMWTTATTSARVRWQTRPALRSADFFAATVKLASEGRIRPDGTPDIWDSALLLRAYRHEFQLGLLPPMVMGVVVALLAALARLLGRRL